MRQYRTIFFVAAALMLLGATCNPNAGLNPPSGESASQPASSGPSVQLSNEDGQPLPNNTIKKTHVIGRSTCPDPLPPVKVEINGQSSGFDLQLNGLVDYLEVNEQMTRANMIGTGILSGLQFNCNISSLDSQEIRIDAGFALDCAGNSIDCPQGAEITIPIELEVLTTEDADKREAGE